MRSMINRPRAPSRRSPDAVIEPSGNAIAAAILRRSGVSGIMASRPGIEQLIVKKLLTSVVRNRRRGVRHRLLFFRWHLDRLDFPGLIVKCLKLEFANPSNQYRQNRLFTYGQRQNTGQKPTH